MLISKKMNEAINRQICNEFGASLQYVAIAAYFAGESLQVLANHFFRQAEEEREHAMKFVKYILDAGATVELGGLPPTVSKFKSAEEAVKLSLEWEMTVTKQINALLEQAIKENDYITQHFLGWFVNEQLEEVSSMDNLLRVIRRAGPNNLLYVEDYVSRLKPAGGEPEGAES